MNIHHLELFYYVAKHGGISEAVRNIPYGIQQPAVSGQVIQLEEYLGVTLFQRRPFALTKAGGELYAFIRPFFDNLGAVGDKLRGGISQHVRIGASEIVLRDHLPDVIQNARKKFPKLRFTLHEGYQPELESMLQKREIDVAVTLLDNKPTSGTQTLPLLKLPLILLVEKSAALQSAEELWKRDRIEETLISLPANETICKNFQQTLARLGVDWFTGIEVSSLALVEAYVGKGYGIGLSVEPPKAKFSPQVRPLPLPDFPPVTLGVMWLGRPAPLMQSLLNAMQERVEFLRK
ncbi:MAG: LysR family transcriptional regulator [Verrucomicrobia bacterium]|nr:LysR family transcriptional regulator [Verrucomicrobiota bacterium]